MIIKVTQKHIDEGDPGMCSDCPVALALLENYDNVVVQNDEILCWLGINQIDFNVPVEVFDFIKAFDNHKSVKPFEFELEI